MEIISIENGTHYVWGGNCDGNPPYMKKLQNSWIATFISRILIVRGSEG